MQVFSDIPINALKEQFNKQNNQAVKPSKNKAYFETSLKQNVTISSDVFCWIKLDPNATTPPSDIDGMLPLLLVISESIESDFLSE